MQTKRRARALAAVAAALPLFGFGTPLAQARSGEKSPASQVLLPQEAALHVLNRLGFGPRPGDVDRVLEMGISRYIDEQLHPARIADAALERHLRGLPTLQMTTAELFDNFEKPLREARRLRREELARKGDAAESGEAAEAEIQKYRDMIPPEKRPRRIIEELSAGRVLCAAYAERQLNEVLVDFWMNHFNVYAAKGLDRVFVTSFERDVVRPRVWGKFEDLLMATAKSPAMLFYLDNARSVADEAHRPAMASAGLFGRPRLSRMDADRMARAKANAPTGINENYARELMELHTLGVDGGYTQRDVTELARVLTGWSIERRGAGAGFVFRAAMHDVGGKTVLGHTFPAGGGIEEGETMIRILAHQPSTARHIAYELCQRLVADDPPKALVDRVAKRFLATDGDLRETVRAIVTNPEFLEPRYFRAKVKSPFEYVVSAVRAVGGSTDGKALAREIAQMGEPLYLCQPPTGYSNAGQAWVSSGALVARLNFALALAAGRVPGTEADLESLIPPEEARDPNKAVDALARALTGGELSPETERTIASRVESRVAPAADPGANTQLPMIAGLILGSPEFQRR